jgi:hypothetical protein
MTGAGRALCLIEFKMEDSYYVEYKQDGRPRQHKFLCERRRKSVFPAEIGKNAAVQKKTIWTSPTLFAAKLGIKTADDKVSDKQKRAKSYFMQQFTRAFPNADTDALFDVNGRVNGDQIFRLLNSARAKQDRFDELDGSFSRYVEQHNLTIEDLSVKERADLLSRVSKSLSTSTAFIASVEGAQGRGDPWTHFEMELKNRKSMEAAPLKQQARSEAPVVRVERSRGDTRAAVRRRVILESLSRYFEEFPEEGKGLDADAKERIFENTNAFIQMKSGDIQRTENEFGGAWQYFKHDLEITSYPRRFGKTVRFEDVSQPAPPSKQAPHRVADLFFQKELRNRELDHSQIEKCHLYLMQARDLHQPDPTNVTELKRRVDDVVIRLTGKGRV